MCYGTLADTRLAVTISNYAHTRDVLAVITVTDGYVYLITCSVITNVITTCNA